MSRASIQVIYDDNDIRIMWHPGKSDFVLVTFNDLITLADENTFFADLPVYKADIACIGIMAKTGNWFPKTSMQTGAAAILPLISSYKSRVMWGGSMGGYGAVKFSHLLSATDVVSLCPQWSLDPGECNGNSTGWPGFFTRSMTGMGIRHGDVSGRVFVLTDLFNKVDRFHAEMIKGNYPDVTIINVPLVAHRVTSVLAGTQNLLAVVKAARANDSFELLRISRHARRFYDSRIHALIEQILIRYPRLVASFLSKAPSDDVEVRKWYVKFLFPIVDWLLKNQDHEGAIEYITTLRDGLLDPQSQVMAAIWLSKLSGIKIKIMTCHNTALVYRLAERVVGQTEKSLGALRPSEVVVHLRLTGGLASFYVEEDGIKVDLWLNDIGLLVEHFDPEQYGKLMYFRIASVVPGTFALSYNGRFLTADANGRVICNRQSAGKWEAFHLG